MRRLTNGTAIAALVALATLTATVNVAEARLVRGPDTGTRNHRHQSNFEFVLEGGLAEPMGDQQDPWTLDYETGLGVSTGWEFGVRFRQWLSDYFAVSPAFHYTRFGDNTGVFDDTNTAYVIGSRVYRYGIDFHAFMGGPRSGFRPFLTGGVALAHNVYQDEEQYGGYYKTSVNTPAYSAGLGFKMNNIELVGEYTYNRFTTANIDFDGRSLDYNWDYLIVRAGLSFGR
jgi:hypothetical protein